jgi:hypothetical protein
MLKAELLNVLLEPQNFAKEKGNKSVCKQQFLNMIRTR